MQAKCQTSVLTCVVAPIKTRRQVYSRKAQTSTDLLQLFSSNGTMLPMLTWAPLTSHQRMAGKFGGPVISAQMATCTAGGQLLPTGAMAVVALSAAGTKCASTARWPRRLLKSQLSGTIKQMLVLLTALSHRAISQWVGYVMCVESIGVSHPVNGSASTRLAAHNVTKTKGQEEDQAPNLCRVSRLSRQSCPH